MTLKRVVFFLAVWLLITLVTHSAVLAQNSLRIVFSNPSPDRFTYFSSTSPSADFIISPGGTVSTSGQTIAFSSFAELQADVEGKWFVREGQNVGSFTIESFEEFDFPEVEITSPADGAEVESGEFVTVDVSTTGSPIFFFSASGPLSVVEILFFSGGFVPTLEAGVFEVPVIVNALGFRSFGDFLTRIDDSELSFSIDSGTTLNVTTEIAINVRKSILVNSINVLRGVVVDGGLTEIQESDDVFFRLNPGFTFNSTEAPVWVEFFGNTTGAPSRLNVESGAGTPGITYTAEAWNWVTSTYEKLGSENALFDNDQIVSFEMTPDHVGTQGELRSRIGWRRAGFTINFPWEIRIDQITWN